MTSRSVFAARRGEPAPGHFADATHLPCMTDMAIGEVTSPAATVARAAAGDEAAFARLVAEHHAAMSRVAYVVCADVEVTRDAVQAAWVIAWRRLHTLRDPGQVRAWLVAVAANEARQAVRRRRQVTIVDISVATDQIGGSDPADRIAIVDLARVLRGLKPDDRALLAMRYVAGLDATEIAAHLGGSPSGIRSRLSRLLERLRLDLGEAEDPQP